MIANKHKIIGQLPAKLEPNAEYFVRAATGFDLYVADSTGQVAHKINTNDDMMSFLRDKLESLEFQMSNKKWLDNICIDSRAVKTSQKEYAAAIYNLDRVLKKGDIVIIRFKASYDNNGNSDCYLRPYVSGQTPTSLSIKQADGEIFEVGVIVLTDNSLNNTLRFYNFPNNSTNNAITIIHWTEVYVIEK